MIIYILLALLVLAVVAIGYIVVFMLIPAMDSLIRLSEYIDKRVIELERESDK